MSISRLPFRLRLTLSFAAIIVVLFGGLALLLQTRFSASLDQGINRSLRTRSPRASWMTAVAAKA